MKKIIIESQFLYQYNNPETGVTVGGSQRYAIELGRLFYDLGWIVLYATKACRYYEENLKNIGKIIAFPVPYGEKGTVLFSKKVFDLCDKEQPNVVCYSDIQVGLFFCWKNSFAIQHGISWDIPTRKLRNLFEGFLYTKATMRYKKVICVDTNFINWMREHSIEYFSNPESLVYIPNFADENIFKYMQREWNKGDPLTLLYPRRFVQHRGYDIFMDMCSELKGDGFDIYPVIACENFREDEFNQKYPNYYTLGAKIVHPDLNEIQQLYYNAFLTFIPTRWSEGTSLSAIESISCGCPVIGSDVGGIANVIIPGYNGEIVAPSAKAFAHLTREYLKNPDKRNMLARNCASMNEIFGITRWRQRILQAIGELI